MKFPEHKCGLYLSHNEHKDTYTPIEEYLSDNKDAVIDDYEYAKCATTGEVWCLQWYPDTPIGFYRVIGSSLEAVLSVANKYGGCK